MKEDKYKGYKSFTPLRCKACGSYIDEDIHDSYCLDCLSEIEKDDVDLWDEDFEDYEECFVWEE